MLTRHIIHVSVFVYRITIYDYKLCVIRMHFSIVVNPFFFFFFCFWSTSNEKQLLWNEHIFEYGIFEKCLVISDSWKANIAQAPFIQIRITVKNCLITIIFNSLLYFFPSSSIPLMKFVIRQTFEGHQEYIFENWLYSSNRTMIVCILYNNKNRFNDKK